jgi:outer membrane protein assembly factor BamB
MEGGPGRTHGFTAIVALGFVVASARCGSNGSGQGSGASILQHQVNARRDGVIIDPAITLLTAPLMHLDPTFAGAVDGQVYAQPLFVDGLGEAKDMILVATENDEVYALDAATGLALWNTKLATELRVSQLACGDVDPYGITGTPVIDLPSRRMFLDAFTTSDSGMTIRHFIFALSIDDGSVVPGWPVDVEAALAAEGKAFVSKSQNQRGALAVMGDAVYVPFGGLSGDCGTYHGWVVEVEMNNPTKVNAWSTAGLGGGIWATGGLASDGNRIYASTGNTIGVTQWSGGEAVVALPSGVAFTGSPDDYWAPMNWMQLDAGDEDLGASGPIVFDLPGSTPSEMILALGKDGHGYLMDRNHLGGIVAPVAEVMAVTGAIMGGANLYTTDQGVFVALRGACANGAGNLAAVRILPGAPPTMTAAWCANQHGLGSPITTTSDGTHDVIVWATGATGDNRLHAFDGRTGAIVFDGGGAGDVMAYTPQWTTPIAAKGRIFVGSSGQVYAFTAK